MQMKYVEYMVLNKKVILLYIQLMEVLQEIEMYIYNTIKFIKAFISLAESRFGFTDPKLR